MFWLESRNVHYEIFIINISWSNSLSITSMKFYVMQYLTSTTSVFYWNTDICFNKNTTPFFLDHYIYHYHIDHYIIIITAGFYTIDLLSTCCRPFSIIIALKSRQIHAKNSLSRLNPNKCQLNISSEYENNIICILTLNKRSNLIYLDVILNGIKLWWWYDMMMNMIFNSSY